MNAHGRIMNAAECMAKLFNYAWEMRKSWRQQPLFNIYKGFKNLFTLSFSSML